MAAAPPGAGAATASPGADLARNAFELVDCRCGDCHPPGDYVGSDDQRHVCAVCTGAPMICCDRCSRWYHLACLRMNDTDIPFGDFHCYRCTGKFNRVRPGVGTSGSHDFVVETALDAAAGTSLRLLRVSVANLRARAATIAASRAAASLGSSSSTSSSSSAAATTTKAVVAAAPYPSPLPARDAALQAPDLLAHVLSFLPLCDVVRATGVCRAWRGAVGSSPALWRELDFTCAWDRVTDAVLAPPALLAAQLHHARSLNLSRCVLVSRDGVAAALAQTTAGGGGGGGGLVQLNLSFCVQLQDRLLLQCAPPAGPPAAAVAAAGAAVTAATAASSAVELRRSGRKRPATDALGSGANDEAAVSAPTTASTAAVVLQPAPPVAAVFSFSRLQCLDLSGTDIALTAGALRHLSVCAPALRHVSLVHSAADVSWATVRTLIDAVTASQLAAAGGSLEGLGLTPAAAKLIGYTSPTQPAPQPSSSAAAAGAGAGAGGSTLQQSLPSLPPRLKHPMLPSSACLLVSAPIHPGYDDGDGAEPDDRKQICAVVFPGAFVRRSSGASGGSSSGSGGGGDAASAAQPHHARDRARAHEAAAAAASALALAQSLQAAAAAAAAEYAPAATGYPNSIMLPDAPSAAASVPQRPNFTNPDFVHRTRSSPLQFMATSLVQRADVDRVLLGLTAGCGCSLSAQCTQPAAGVAAAPPPPAGPPSAAAATADEPLSFAPIYLCQSPDDWRTHGAMHELAARGVALLPTLDELGPATGPYTAAGAAGTAAAASAHEAAATASSAPGLRTSSYATAAGAKAATERAHELRTTATRLVADGADSLPHALDALEKSLELVPHPTVHLHAAFLADRLYRWPDALRHSYAALALEPRCGTAAMHIAGALSQSGLPTRDAAATVEEWLDAAEAGQVFTPGTCADVFAERGVVRLRQGRHVEAADNLAVALHFAQWAPQQRQTGSASLLVKALRLLLRAAEQRRRDGQPSTSSAGGGSGGARAGGR